MQSWKIPTSRGLSPKIGLKIHERRRLQPLKSKELQVHRMCAEINKQNVWSRYESACSLGSQRWIPQWNRSQEGHADQCDGKLKSLL